MLSNAMKSSAACPVRVWVATPLLTRAQLPPRVTLAPAKLFNGSQTTFFIHLPCPLRQDPLTPCMARRHYELMHERMP